MSGLLLLGIASHARATVLRAAALVAVPAIGVVIYLTYSRSSLLAAIVGVAVLVALARNRWTLVIQLVSTATAIGAAIAATDGQREIALATGSVGAGTVLLVVVVGGLALGVVGAATALVGTDRLRFPARTARIATVTLGIVAITAGTAFAVVKGSEVWDRFATVENESALGSQSRLTMLSNGNRVAQWRTALDAWKDDRLTGHGAGTFELIYNRKGDDSQFVRDAHSAPLEALAEQGLVGLALLLTFMGSAMAAGYLAIRRAVDDRDRGLAAGATGAVAAFLVGSCFDWF
jgi:O-antigen ligase